MAEASTIHLLSQESAIALSGEQAISNLGAANRSHPALRDRICFLALRSKLIRQIVITEDLWLKGNTIALADTHRSPCPIPTGRTTCKIYSEIFLPETGVARDSR